MSSDDTKGDPTIAARMPQKLVDGLEEIKPLLRQLPEYQTRKLTQSELFRIAVAHGLHRLREQLAARVDDAEQVDLLESPQEELSIDDEPNG